MSGYQNNNYIGGCYRKLQGRQRVDEENARRERGRHGKGTKLPRKSPTYREQSDTSGPDTDSLVQAYLSIVASYLREMASTQCLVLPLHPAWKATEPACEPAVAGQGRRRSARRFFLPI
ncbi:hypothetical protein ACVWZW_004006 [Bradyrhizobium sp. F1.13.4]